MSAPSVILTPEWYRAEQMAHCARKDRERAERVLIACRQKELQAALTLKEITLALTAPIPLLAVPTSPNCESAPLQATLPAVA